MVILQYILNIFYYMTQIDRHKKGDDLLRPSPGCKDQIV